MGHGLTCSTYRENLKFGYVVDTSRNNMQAKGITFWGKIMIPFVTSKIENEV